MDILKAIEVLRRATGPPRGEPRAPGGTDRQAKIQAATCAAQHIVRESKSASAQSSEFLQAMRFVIQLLLRLCCDGDTGVALVAREKVTLLVRKFSALHPERLLTGILLPGVRDTGGKSPALQLMAEVIQFLAPSSMPNFNKLFIPEAIRLMRTRQPDAIKAFGQSSALIVRAIGFHLTSEMFDALWDDATALLRDPSDDVRRGAADVLLALFRYSPRVNVGDRLNGLVQRAVSAFATATAAASAPPSQPGTQPQSPQAAPASGPTSPAMAPFVGITIVPGMPGSDPAAATMAAVNTAFNTETTAVAEDPEDPQAGFAEARGILGALTPLCSALLEVALERCLSLNEYAPFHQLSPALATIGSVFLQASTDHLILAPALELLNSTIHRFHQLDQPLNWSEEVAVKQLQQLGEVLRQFTKNVKFPKVSVVAPVLVYAGNLVLAFPALWVTHVCAKSEEPSIFEIIKRMYRHEDHQLSGNAAVCISRMIAATLQRPVLGLSIDDHIREFDDLMALKASRLGSNPYWSDEPTSGDAFTQKLLLTGLAACIPQMLRCGDLAERAVAAIWECLLHHHDPVNKVNQFWGVKCELLAVLQATDFTLTAFYSPRSCPNLQPAALWYCAAMLADEDYRVRQRAAQCLSGMLPTLVQPTIPNSCPLQPLQFLDHSLASLECIIAKVAPMAASGTTALTDRRNLRLITRSLLGSHIYPAITTAEISNLGAILDHCLGRVRGAIAFTCPTGALGASTAQSNPAISASQPETKAESMGQAVANAMAIPKATLSGWLTLLQLLAEHYSTQGANLLEPYIADIAAGLLDVLRNSVQLGDMALLLNLFRVCKALFANYAPASGTPPHVEEVLTGLVGALVLFAQLMLQVVCAAESELINDEDSPLPVLVELDAPLNRLPQGLPGSSEFEAQANRLRDALRTVYNTWWSGLSGAKADTSGGTQFPELHEACLDALGAVLHSAPRSLAAVLDGQLAFLFSLFGETLRTLPRASINCLNGLFVGIFGTPRVTRPMWSPVMAWARSDVADAAAAPVYNIGPQTLIFCEPPSSVEALLSQASPLLLASPAPPTQLGASTSGAVRTSTNVTLSPLWYDPLARVSHAFVSAHSASVRLAAMQLLFNAVAHGVDLDRIDPEQVFLGQLMRQLSDIESWLPHAVSLAFPILQWVLLVQHMQQQGQPGGGSASRSGSSTTQPVSLSSSLTPTTLAPPLSSTPSAQELSRTMSGRGKLTATPSMAFPLPPTLIHPATSLPNMAALPAPSQGPKRVSAVLLADAVAYGQSILGTYTTMYATRLLACLLPLSRFSLPLLLPTTGKPWWSTATGLRVLGNNLRESLPAADVSVGIYDRLLGLICGRNLEVNWGDPRGLLHDTMQVLYLLAPLTRDRAPTLARALDQLPASWRTSGTPNTDVIEWSLFQTVVLSRLLYALAKPPESARLVAPPLPVLRTVLNLLLAAVRLVQHPPHGPQGTQISTTALVRPAAADFLLRAALQSTVDALQLLEPTVLTNTPTDSLVLLVTDVLSLLGALRSELTHLFLPQEEFPDPPPLPPAIPQQMAVFPSSVDALGFPSSTWTTSQPAQLPTEPSRQTRATSEARPGHGNAFRRSVPGSFLAYVRLCLVLQKLNQAVPASILDVWLRAITYLGKPRDSVTPVPTHPQLAVVDILFFAFLSLPPAVYIAAFHHSEMWALLFAHHTEPLVAACLPTLRTALPSHDVVFGHEPEQQLESALAGFMWMYLSDVYRWEAWHTREARLQPHPQAAPITPHGFPPGFLSRLAAALVFIRQFPALPATIHVLQHFVYYRATPGIDRKLVSKTLQILLTRYPSLAAVPPPAVQPVIMGNSGLAKAGPRNSSPPPRPVRGQPGQAEAISPSAALRPRPVGTAPSSPARSQPVDVPPPWTDDVKWALSRIPGTLHSSPRLTMAFAVHYSCPPRPPSEKGAEKTWQPQRHAALRHPDRVLRSLPPDVLRLTLWHPDFNASCVLNLVELVDDVERQTVLFEFLVHRFQRILGRSAKIVGSVQSHPSTPIAPKKQAQPAGSPPVEVEPAASSSAVQRIAPQPPPEAPMSGYAVDRYISLGRVDVLGSEFDEAPQHSHNRSPNSSSSHPARSQSVPVPLGDETHAPGQRRASLRHHSAQPGGHDAVVYDDEHWWTDVFLLLRTFSRLVQRGQDIQGGSRPRACIFSIFNLAFDFAFLVHVADQELPAATPAFMEHCDTSRISVLLEYCWAVHAYLFSGMADGESGPFALRKESEKEGNFETADEAEMAAWRGFFRRSCCLFLYANAVSLPRTPWRKSSPLLAMQQLIVRPPSVVLTAAINVLLQHHTVLQSPPSEIGTLFIEPPGNPIQTQLRMSTNVGWQLTKLFPSCLVGRLLEDVSYSDAPTVQVLILALAKIGVNRHMYKKIAKTLLPHLLTALPSDFPPPTIPAAVSLPSGGIPEGLAPDAPLLSSPTQGFSLLLSLTTTLLLALRSSADTVNPLSFPTSYAVQENPYLWSHLHGTFAPELGGALGAMRRLVQHCYGHDRHAQLVDLARQRRSARRGQCALPHLLNHHLLPALTTTGRNHTADDRSNTAASVYSALLSAVTGNVKVAPPFLISLVLRSLALILSRNTELTCVVQSRLSAHQLLKSATALFKHLSVKDTPTLVVSSGATAMGMSLARGDVMQLSLSDSNLDAVDFISAQYVSLVGSLAVAAQFSGGNAGHASAADSAVSDVLDMVTNAVEGSCFSSGVAYQCVTALVKSKVMPFLVKFLPYWVDRVQAELAVHRVLPSLAHLFHSQLDAVVRTVLFAARDCEMKGFTRKVWEGLWATLDSQARVYQRRVVMFALQGVCDLVLSFSLSHTQRQMLALLVSPAPAAPAPATRAPSPEQAAPSQPVQQRPRRQSKRLSGIKEWVRDLRDKSGKPTTAPATHAGPGSSPTAAAAGRRRSGSASELQSAYARAKGGAPMVGASTVRGRDRAGSWNDWADVRQLVHYVLLLCTMYTEAPADSGSNSQEVYELSQNMKLTVVQLVKQFRDPLPRGAEVILSGLSWLVCDFVPLHEGLPLLLAESLHGSCPLATFSLLVPALLPQLSRSLSVLPPGTTGEELGSPLARSPEALGSAFWQWVDVCLDVAARRDQIIAGIWCLMQTCCATLRATDSRNYDALACEWAEHLPPGPLPLLHYPLLSTEVGEDGLASSCALTPTRSTSRSSSRSYSPAVSVASTDASNVSLGLDTNELWGALLTPLAHPLHYAAGESSSNTSAAAFCFATVAACLGFVSLLTASGQLHTMSKMYGVLSHLRSQAERDAAWDDGSVALLRWLGQYVRLAHDAAVTEPLAT